jgi:branched-chain amino acid transport system substrate-binding protein
MELAYDAARLLADAIRRFQTPPEPLREALAATKGFPGVTGDLTFDLERNPVKPIAILEIQKGRYTFVKRLAPDRR